MSAMIPSEGSFTDGEDFSGGGGTLPIQPDFLQEGLDRLKSVATGSYTAMLSLFGGKSNKLAGVEMRSCWISLKD
ncbi:MAG: hypothetical protein ABSC61_01140 [Anaerolineales bacterium]